MRSFAVASLLAGCFTPDDLALTVPDVGGAKAIAIATRDPRGTSLTTYDLQLDDRIRFSLGYEEGERLDVAALLYDTTLAESEIPLGAIEIDGPAEGRPFPFERGYQTAVEDGAASWSEIASVPEWLSSVRLPPRTCPELQVRAETFAGSGDRTKGMACYGNTALIATYGSSARYFGVTEDAITEIFTDISSTFRPRDVAARIDGRWVIAGVDTVTRETELWISDVNGSFVKTSTRGGLAGAFRIDVGRSEADRDQVYLMTELGEVLRFNGMTWSSMRARVLDQPIMDDRYGMTWVAAETVVVFGPYLIGSLEGRRLTVLSPASEIETDLGALASTWSVAYVPEYGTLAGTTDGEIFRLAGDRWELFIGNDFYNWSVVSMSTFRGEPVYGGSEGRLIFRLATSPCLAASGGHSHTSLCPFDGGLLSANVNLDQDPALVWVK